MLTHQRATELLRYCPTTGHLFWLKTNSNRAKAGTRAGTGQPGAYRGVRIDGVRYLEHRLIWFLTHGNWPSNLLDHRNTCKDKNTLVNLREANHSQNKSNRRKQANNTSGVKGAYWHRRAGKWAAQIQVNGTNHYLGLHTNKEAAAAAYAAAAKHHFKEFARS
jgi:hypothetical protein